MANTDETLGFMNNDEFGRELSCALLTRRAQDVKAAEELLKQQTDIDHPVNQTLAAAIIDKCTKRRVQVMDAARMGMPGVCVKSDIHEFDQCLLKPGLFVAFVQRVLTTLYEHYGLKQCSGARVAFCGYGYNSPFQASILVLFDDEAPIEGDTLIFFPV